MVSLEPFLCVFIIYTRDSGTILHVLVRDFIFLSVESGSVVSVFIFVFKMGFLVV